MEKPRDYFQEWIYRYGVDELAKRLKLAHNTIWYWYRRRTVPHSRHAYILIKLSNGLLKWSDIYDPFYKNIKT